jgi:peptide/nickel transport system substrate-binding protein
MGGQRIRRGLSQAALVLLATLLLSGGAIRSAMAQDEQPQSGGTLIFGSSVEPQCLDPHISAQDATNMLGRYVLDSLVAQQPDGTFAPWLAESYEVSDDVTQFTFHLRQDVTFSDGTPFNAEAVKANLDHIANPETKSQYSISLLGPYQGTEAVDEFTARVTFTEGFSPFLQALSQPFLGIESPAALAANAPCSAPIGSGPFVISTVEPQQGITLTKNANYNWAPANASHTGPAYLDTIDIRWIPDNAVRTGSISSGQVDVADTIEPKEVEGLSSAGLQVMSNDAPGAPYMLFINVSNAPWDDVRVRQAFLYSLDLDGIVNALYFGQYKRAWGPIAPNTFGYDPTIENSWQQDLDKANALLDEAGWVKNGDFREKDGQRLVARWPYAQGTREQRDAIGQLIKEQAKEVGIDVDIQAVGVGPYLEAAQSNQYDIGDFSFVRSDPDVLRSLFDSTNRVTAEQIRQNWSQLQDPEVDGWVRAAAQTVDPEARAELYAKVQHYVVENAVIVPVYVPANIVVSAEKVHGIAADPQGYPTFYDAWVDQ